MGAAVAAVSLRGVPWLRARFQRRRRSRRPSTISVVSLIPGSTGGLRRSSTTRSRSSRRPIRGSRSSRSSTSGSACDVRGEARRGDAADRVHRPVHRRALARRERSARQPDEVREGASVLQQVQPGGDRRGHRRQGPGHRDPDRRLRPGAAATTASSSARRASTPTTRRRPGRSSRPTRSRSPRRPAWPATPRWARATTPPAGS